MTRIRKHLSPALVLSVVAVFIALGGGAYAALGKNSVGSKQIKKNAVVTSKLKNNAVTTAKIKNDNVTGAKVKESSLGTVPKATSADSASTAVTASKTDGYLTFPQTRYTATPGINDAAAFSAAPENVMFTVGPITIYSKCITNTTTVSTRAEVFIKTSENGVIFDSDDDEIDGDPDFLNTGTLESDRQLLDTSAAANAASVDMDSSYATQVMTPGGVSFEMQPGIAVKNGNLAGGNGLYGAGDVCLVSGSLVQRTG